jgi:DNA-binding LytR/AlgR family response regulator
MAKNRILAVEDDELHADVLRMTMHKLGHELISIVDNSNDLFRMINATRPDLLLMDIDIGEELNGIDIVKKINEQYNLPVVYVTSLQEQEIYKAARATEPEGFVLKPYNPITLQAAIDFSILRKEKEKNGKIKEERTAVKSESVFVKDGNSLVKIKVQDIQLIEAYDKYCYVYTKEKKYLLSIQLKNAVSQLPDDQFIQVHRSYLINFESIAKVRLAENIVEVAGKDIPISKSHKGELFSRLNLL